MAVSLPILQELSESEIMAWDPEIRAIIHRQPLEQKERDSFPPYTVSSFDAAIILIREKFPDYKPDKLCVKIIDHGNGRKLTMIYVLQQLTFAHGI